MSAKSNIGIDAAFKSLITNVYAQVNQKHIISNPTEQGVKLGTATTKSNKKGTCCWQEVFLRWFSLSIIFSIIVEGRNHWQIKSIFDWVGVTVFPWAHQRLNRTDCECRGLHCFSGVCFIGIACQLLILNKTTSKRFVLDAVCALAKLLPNALVELRIRWA